jgi:L-amino acid N-acyltransferase YncA
MEVEGSPVLHFDPSYVYMYHAFTRPSCRGRRLHAIGMAAALVAFVKEGHEGLISYVDSSNLASLKSFHRMGFREFGYLVLLNVGARYHWRTTRGCRKHGLRVEAPS